MILKEIYRCVTYLRNKKKISLTHNVEVINVTRRFCQKMCNECVEKSEASSSQPKAFGGAMIKTREEFLFSSIPAKNGVKPLLSY